MEDSQYSELKNNLSAVPAKELNISGRLMLTNNLDVKQVLPSKNGFARDYRGLAELMGFPWSSLKKFAESENPTMKILDSWENQSDATLDKLIIYLEEMERYDVINDLKPLLEKNIESYFRNKRLKTPIQVPEVTSISNMVTSTAGSLHRNVMDKALTCDDLKNGECTIYDAYVSYADEDCEYVAKMAHYLENQVGLKLFIRGRDMLAGCAELDTNIEMIKNRCRHMLIILTPNFLNSPACEFQVSFAGSLAIETKENILIPVILADCQMPLILKGVSKIDFTKPYILDWMWQKLISSLSRDNPEFTLTESYGEVPECLRYTSSKPVITLPETKQISFPPVDTASASALAITSGESSENDVESPSPESCPSPKKHLFMKFWKKKGQSSQNSTTSISSGATSGFYTRTHYSTGSIPGNDVNNNENFSSF